MKNKEKERLIKEVKRACPYAWEMARAGGYIPALVCGRIRGRKLNKNLKKLLTKFHIHCCIKTYSELLDKKSMGK